MGSKLRALSSAVPEGKLSSDDLSALFPEWDAAAIVEKTGIQARSIADSGTFASDLATTAARRCLELAETNASEVDLLVVISQTPDFLLPGISSLIQDQLGLGRQLKVLDINQGCSGYPYGLWLIDSLIRIRAVNTALLVTSDTYSKILAASDRSTRAIFGDAASATLLEQSKDPQLGVISSAFGTDGSLFKFLTSGNGIRPTHTEQADLQPDRQGSISTISPLEMNGPAILKFALSAVPPLVDELLEKATLEMSDIDFFVFHQANKFILDLLREKIGIPEDKFVVELSEWGNTVSSSIPLALHNRELPGNNQTLMLVGFGVGLSWSGVIYRT